MAAELSLAQRIHFPPNVIDNLFAQIPLLNQSRLAQGLPVIINLSVGEPHLSINKNIIHFLHQLLDVTDPNLSFNYPQLPGEQACLEAISQLYKQYYAQTDYTTEEVMICNGATQGIWNAFNILINPGDKVLAFEPCYSSYAVQLNMLGGSLIKIPTEERQFKPASSGLEELLNKHPCVKALILNFPNNPTGLDLSLQEVTEIVLILQKYPHLCIIIDDVYRELTTQPHITILDIDPALKNRCIVINSASKGLIGAPGLRIGMVGAKAEWITQMTNMQSLATAGVSWLTQQALIAGINEKLRMTPSYKQWLANTKKDYAINRNYISAELNSMGFKTIPTHNGFFILAQAKNLLGLWIPDAISFKNHRVNNLHEKIQTCIFKTDHHIAAFLLHVAGVAVIPGSAFGIDEYAGYLRFSCAKQMDELRQACFKLKGALASLSETICN